MFHCTARSDLDICRYPAIPQRKDSARQAPEHGVLFNPAAAELHTLSRSPLPKEALVKTWIKRTLFGLLAGTVVLGGLAACGHRNFHHGWHAMSEADVAQFKTRMVERVGSKLDLDAAQKAQLGVLADRLHEQRMALAAGTADPRAELQSLIAGPVFDRAKAGALLQGKLAAVQGKSPGAGGAG